MSFPFSKDIVSDALAKMGIADVHEATIRQTVSISNELEQRTGEKFIHFEIGSPGLKASEIGVTAQKDALDKGVASQYPNIAGIPELNQAASKFIKAFIGVDVPARCCIPTVGSMMGTFASFLLCCNLTSGKDTVLFINPGFSVQPLQAKILGFGRVDFDVYNNRGPQLREQLETLLQKGNIAAIVYSNPNNPSWVCLADEELAIVGELATKYDAIVIEDLAYLGMDFRRDISHPFRPPYQVSVANHTDNYMLMLSASKIFSYAGERIAVTAISDKLFHRKYAALKEKYGVETLGNAFVYVILYALSSGVSHSAQHALAAMYEAACAGELNFVKETSEYARRAKLLKEVFLRNGFHIVYDKDLDETLSDGFFFTIGRKGFTGDSLIDTLIYYGVSAMSLSSTGSRQEGIRVCTSVIKDEELPILDERLRLFNQNHPY